MVEERRGGQVQVVLISSALPITTSIIDLIHLIPPAQVLEPYYYQATIQKAPFIAHQTEP